MIRATASSFRRILSKLPRREGGAQPIVSLHDSKRERDSLFWSYEFSFRKRETHIQSHTYIHTHTHTRLRVQHYEKRNGRDEMESRREGDPFWHVLERRSDSQERREKKRVTARYHALPPVQIPLDATVRNFQKLNSFNFEFSTERITAVFSPPRA